MNIEVTALGLGGRVSGGSGGSYDDSAIKRRISEVESAVTDVKKTVDSLPKGGGTGDTAAKQEIAALKERIAKIEATRKEYEAAYVPRSEMQAIIPNNNLVTIPFKKTFSAVPMVKVVLDIKDTSVRISYQANSTTTGFDIAVSYTGTLNGIWYEAHLVE